MKNSETPKSWKTRSSSLSIMSVYLFPVNVLIAISWICLWLQARLASLGLQKTVAELRSISSKPQSEKRKHNKVDYFSTPLRRSNRLKGNSSELALRSSDRLNENSCRTAKSLYYCLFSPFFSGLISPHKCGFWNENVSFFVLLIGKLGLFEEGDDEDDIEMRPANAPLLRVKDGLILHLTPEALARRCASKDRGTIYDPFLGICCHFCRFWTSSRMHLAYFFFAFHFTKCLSSVHYYNHDLITW